jgi:hypothetical protein
MLPPMWGHGLSYCEFDGNKHAIRLNPTPALHKSHELAAVALPACKSRTGCAHNQHPPGADPPQCSMDAKSRHSAPAKKVGAGGYLSKTDSHGGKGKERV